MIYISLTTIPDRLRQWNLIEENLNSLLHQKTDKEYKVIFSIPEHYEIPYDLLKFVDHNSKLSINRKIPDYGSITKIIGVLEYTDDPNDIIIACDDDYVYHEDMLEYHLKKLNEYPNHVICFKGEEGIDKRTWNENGERKFVFRRWSILWPTDKDRYLQIPYHHYSVSYKRKYFKDDFNEKLWEISNIDDLIMSYYLKKNEIWTICVKWDKETDFRVVDRIAFPVVKKIIYSLIQKRETVYKNIPEKIRELLFNFDSAYGKATFIYTEKNDNIN
jgi:hypothetical protein